MCISAETTTVSTSTMPSGPCSSNEDHVVLNYQDVIQGTSQLELSVLVPDLDVTPALLGSDTYLLLPPTSSDKEPIRLVIRRRSVESSSWRFNVASVSLNMVHAHRVDILVYDDDGLVATHRTVRSSILVVHVLVTAADRLFAYLSSLVD